MTEPIEENANLLGHLLVAQPLNSDAYFARSVVVVCSHSNQGAWGLVVNRPLMDPQRESEIWRCLGWDPGHHLDGIGLWQGGPVLTERVIVLHSPDWRGPATQMLTEQIWVTQDPSIFHALHQGQGPRDIKIFLGFSSWSAGQLDGEQQGLPPWRPEQRWLTAPADWDSVMSDRDQDSQWRRAIKTCASHATQTWLS
ncbi:MAG: YqgE/AlgH family protein [Proteobacteria bacterium]|nr:YqgE/AlgH family protein [Pseudomonadota bacterium]